MLLGSTCEEAERSDSTETTSAEGRNDMSKKRTHAVSHGISFGSALAIAISWSTHHSILWAILHGFFSWLYVVYYAVTR